MANRFCAACGAKLLPDSNFCAECGERQPGARQPGAWSSVSLQRYAPAIILVAIVAVVGTVVVIGTMNPKTPASVPRHDNAPQGSTATGTGNLPEGHPPITIPEEVKQAIRDMSKKADAAPDDLDTWKHLAEVQYRAGQLDPTYLAQADSSYHHVLERDPNNLDALRNLGNIAFDQDRHEEAIGLYQQYLKLKPDDFDVQTDLGTMYLSAGKTDQAIQQYDFVLKQDPNFFQAQFNLAIAYRTAGETDKVMPALEKARTMAKDDQSRNQVEQVIARLKGEPPPAAAGAGAPAMAANPPAASAPASDTFQGGIDAVFRQHPIIGPKVDHIEWSGADAARVYLNDFPMDQMPPEMATMFADRMKAKIKEQKDAHQVTQPTHFDLVDNASGKVMSTITE